jgi:hypothetical protein
VRIRAASDGGLCGEILRTLIRRFQVLAPTQPPPASPRFSPNFRVPSDQSSFGKNFRILRPFHLAFKTKMERVPHHSLPQKCRSKNNLVCQEMDLNVTHLRRRCRVCKHAALWGPGGWLMLRPAGLER